MGVSDVRADEDSSRSFTFDSCYSYLSHPALPSREPGVLQPEPPLDHSILHPLVEQTIADYSSASLLLRLPGVIPIPAFDTDVPMPSGRWVNEERTAFTPEVEAILSRPVHTIPAAAQGRHVVDVPLIVRAPSPDANTPAFRSALLRSMGVPDYLLDSKVLLVSFGGQAIPRPRTRPPTPLSSPLTRRTKSQLSSASLEPPQDELREAGLLPKGWIAIVTGLSGGDNAIRDDLPYGFFASEKDVYVPDLTWIADCVLGKLVRILLLRQYERASLTVPSSPLTRRATAPARRPCRAVHRSSTVSAFALPHAFLSPTLTPARARAVPRPLFVEEFGLKRLMHARGASLELSRVDFEAGRWELHIEEAYELGRAAKEEARRVGFEDERAGEVIRCEIERFLAEWER